uniref:MBL fold metallo-hydrolase n=1 Tax=Thermofilum pendens TaxID=2269 RepID=A0A7C3SPL2_THEPE
MIVLFDNGNHKVAVFRDLTPKGHVQANQVVFVDSGEGLLADPSGRGVFSRLASEISSVVPAPKVRYIFFSHQDPDVTGASASWFVSLPNAVILIPRLWSRFIPHFFPQDTSISHRVQEIPDEGGVVKLGASELRIIPAHFLHSPGNFQIYDPVSKILFSGDLFASLLPEGVDYDFVENFEEHVKYMEPFHRRYIPSMRAIEMWLEQVRNLEIETIVPQHGAILRGRESVTKALAWIRTVKCFLD